MKVLCSLLLLTTLSFQGLSQDNNKVYVLDTIKGWRTELMHLPLDFAPTINVQGIEDIRFAPGWSRKEAEDFWTYKFVWVLDSDPLLDINKLNDILKQYFDGLLKTVGKSKKNEQSRISPTQVEIKAQIDNSFIGSIIIWDVFFTQADIHLNFKVNSISYTQKHLIVFELSPQPFENQVWFKMAKIGIMQIYN